MLKILPIFIFLFSSLIGYSQYEAECFINTKKEITLTIENVPRDSMRIQDTVFINGQTRYVDTVIGVRGFDVNPYMQKIVGCKMPDFNFFNLNGEEHSVYKMQNDFTIIFFSSIHCGDGCNNQLRELGKLKSTLKDSVSVINIFEETDARISEYVKDYDSNMDYVANADLITLKYSFGGALVFILDKYKNIIYVKHGTRYNYTPTEIYNEMLQKIRATVCSD